MLLILSFLRLPLQLLSVLCSSEGLSLYTMLGVEKEATDEEIRKSYRKVSVPVAFASPTTRNSTVWLHEQWAESFYELPSKSKPMHIIGQLGSSLKHLFLHIFIQVVKQIVCSLPLAPLVFRLCPCFIPFVHAAGIEASSRQEP